MPYSAGPNIAARPNLVFEYDTGDVANSYKGEPTTNLLPYPEVFTSWGTSAMVIRPDRVMAPDGTLTAYSMYSTSGTYPAISTTITPPNTNPYRGSVWMRSNTGVNQTINFNLFRASPWGLAEQTDITVTPSWARYDVSMTALDTTTHVPWLGRHISAGASVDISIWRAQVENKSHVTPFVVGTRSNTQGLLDVSGYNRTIDLANMSFNSSAQMIFDGTDDYIPSIGTAVVPAGSVPYTVSVWVNRGRNNVGYEELLAQWTYANSGNSFFFGFNNSNVRFSDSWNDVSVSGAGNTNVWMNLVGVNTGTNAYIYLNGALAATKGSALTYTGTGPLLMGRQGELSSEYFLGRMNNVQIYNSALSAQEVRRNYNQLKGRFNLQ